MIVDLHNHGDLSKNTSVQIKDYRKAAENLNISFALTNHNALNKKTFESGKIQIFSGIEVLCNSGDFLVFGVSESCLVYRQDIFKLIDYVHDQGGVIIAAHPYSRYGLYKVLEEKEADKVVDAIDAIETLNGLNTPEENEKAMTLAKRFKKTSVGGSDAHHLNQMFVYGTKFDEDIRDMKSLVEAIRHGQCKAVKLPC